MMIRLTRAQVQPIGLDIGFDSIKMLQLAAVGESLEVVAAARHALSEEVRTTPELRIPVAVDLIRQMLRSNPFVGRRVVAALPRDILHVKNLRLPVMPLQELSSAVQFEARNIFHFDTEQAHVQFLPAGEVRQGSDVRQEVVVLAARHGDVDNFLEQMHCCGAVVESLDFEPCAIYRGVERFIRRREDENEVHVLVDIGLRRSQVIIGKGHEISFFKPIDIGGLDLHEAVSRKLGITLEEARALRRRLSEAPTAIDAAKRDSVRQAVFDATRSGLEELAREISLCLRYYSVTFRGHRPSRVRLIGGESCDPQLRNVLGAGLSIPVEASSPLYSVSYGNMKASDRSGPMCEWAMAFGLSLKLTRHYFGARDGKPRYQMDGQASAAVAQLVDVTGELETFSDGGDGSVAAPAAAGPGQEAAHA